jgi:dihydropteroate synthase
VTSNILRLFPQFPQRAEQWTLRSLTLRLSGRPLLMGIVNVTPDSFSDGGRFFNPEAAVEHALRLAEEGAEILDVGGESTRPGNLPVEAGEQLRRVLPVIEAVTRRSSLPISIDTSSAEVAREAIAAGAQIINDITGLAGDPAMIEVAASSQAGVCAMHMQGTPQTMQHDPHYGDVVQEVRDYLAARRDALEAAGISRQRIALDPGIGFGKRTAHNLALLSSAWRLHELGCPVLVGHSRKGFLQKVIGDPKADPLYGTIGVALALARQGVQIIRVHDVAPVRQTLLAFEAAGG